MLGLRWLETRSGANGMCRAHNAPQFEAHNISEEAQMEAQKRLQPKLWEGTFLCIELSRVQGKEREALKCNIAQESTPSPVQRQAQYVSMWLLSAKKELGELYFSTEVQRKGEFKSQHSSAKKGELSSQYNQYSQ